MESGGEGWPHPRGGFYLEIYPKEEGAMEAGGMEARSMAVTDMETEPMEGPGMEVGPMEGVPMDGDGNRPFGSEWKKGMALPSPWGKGPAAPTIPIFSV